MFNAVSALFAAAGPTQLVALVPAGCGTGAVAVAGSDGDAAGPVFTEDPLRVVWLRLSVREAAPGASITGEVRLNGPAQGPVSVALASSDPGVAAVPATAACRPAPAAASSR
jgi:hypothetical protein